MLSSPARNLRATAQSEGEGSQAPVCAVLLPGGESCSSRTRGQTFPAGRLARARRRRLPCAKSRAPSSSAPHGRLMVPRPTPALPAGRGSRRLPRDARRKESAKVPGGEVSRSTATGARCKSPSGRCCLQCCGSRSRPARGPGGGCPGPGRPAPRAAAPATATAPGPASSAGPAPSSPRPPPPGPQTPPAGASRSVPAPLQAAPTFLAL